MRREIQLTMGNIEKSLSHIHDGMECLLVIKGTLDVVVDDRSAHLQADDIIIINHGLVHSISGNKGNIVLCLRVSREYLEKECKEIVTYDIQCDSTRADSSENRRYFELKRILTRMLLIYSKKKEGYQLEFNAMFFLFLHHLLQHFKQEKVYTKGKPEGDQDAFAAKILSFINEHYQENISLENLAKEVYMSPQYFSKYFKRKIGVGFLEYVTSVRIEHALKDLIYTDDSILRIAMNQGFANAKSFTEAFRREFGQTPSTYRKSNKKQALSDGQEDKRHEFNIEIEDDLIEFLKYIHQHDLGEEDLDEEIEQVEVSLRDCQTHYYQKPHKIINIENLESALKSETLGQLEHIQEKLGFQYIYFEIFHNIESFRWVRDGNLDYYEPLRIFQSFHKLDLIPIFQINYTALKKAAPWKSLTRSLLLYLKDALDFFITALSKTYVRKWKFEISCSSEEDSKEFYEFYYEFYTCLSSYVTKKNIGLLSLKDSSSQGKEDFKNLLISAKEHDCVPGFVSFYAHPEKELTLIFENPTRSLKHYHDYHLKEIEKIIGECGCQQIDIYMTKWNTLSGRNVAESGTFFRSALIIDALLSVQNRIAGVGYYLNTFEPSIDKPSVDTSILAIFLHYQIKRPIYFVIQVLNKLGSYLLFKRDGLLVTKNEEGDYIIAAFHACYVNPTYSVDSAYVMQEGCSMEIALLGLEPGKYQIKGFVFDKDSAGVFRLWENAGCPNFLDPDIVDYLESTIVPEIMLTEEKVESNYTFYTKLSFNGIILYSLKKIK